MQGLAWKAKSMESITKIQTRRLDNIKTNLTEILCGGMDWIYMAKDRGQLRAVLNTVMNLHVPKIIWKFQSASATSGFSKSTQLPFLGSDHKTNNEANFADTQQILTKIDGRYQGTAT